MKKNRNSCLKKSLFQRKTIQLILLGFIFVSLGFTSVTEGREGKYPSKAIKIVAPFRVGGGSDVEVRAIAPFLQQYLGVPVGIENVVGARGVVCYNKFYRENPDGYTLIFLNLPSPIVPELTTKTEYRTAEYTFIRAVSIKRLILATKYGKFKDFSDFIKQAKIKKPRFAITGPSSDLQGYVLQDRLGMEFIWVPMEAAARGLSAVLGGHVDGVFTFLLSGLPLIEAKKISALMLFADKRDPRVPDIPTPKDLGYDFSLVRVVSGFLGPPGMAADKVKVIAEAVARLPKDPKYMAWAEKRGVVVEHLPSSQFKQVAEEHYKIINKYKNVFR